MIRSILAVLAGIAALTITSFAIEAVANPLLMWMFPQALPNETALSTNQPARLFLYTYSTVCIACGGYVTAWIARRSEMVHVVTMGVIQVGLTVLAMRAFPEKGSLQLWIVTMAMTIPAAWSGGYIRTRTGKPA
jgi:hypothetical protein